MSVNVHVYGVWGIKQDFSHDLNEAYHELHEFYQDAQVPFALFDGMSGEYMVLGHKLFNSGNAHDGFRYGDPEVTQSAESLAQLEAAYKQKFCDMLPDFVDLMNEPFQIIMITHWS